jgi:hypothetical protein
MPDVIPVPGDARTEQVSTDAQSWIAGRVGPRTIAQDAHAPWHTEPGVDKIFPGDVTVEGEE